MASIGIEGLLISNVLAIQTAGTGTVAATAVDMAGYEGVIFITTFGTQDPTVPDAVNQNTLKVSQCDTVGGSYADLTGTLVGISTVDETVIVQVHRPLEQFVKANVVRGTSSTSTGCLAIQYGAKNVPVTNSISGTQVAESHVSPAEGTA